MTLRPQIITTNRFDVSLISPGVSRNAMMIGTAEWGPVGEIVSLSRFNQFIENFGDDDNTGNLTGVKGVELFFRNGSPLRFIRVTNGSETKSSLVLNNDGSAAITLTAKYDGTLGNRILVEVTEVGSNRAIAIKVGNIIERINNSGAGFENNDDIVEAINTISQYVTAEKDSNNLIDAVTETQMTGGANGDTNIPTAAYTTLWDDKLSTERFNYLLIPGKTEDAFHTTMLTKVEEKANVEKLRSRYITGVEVDELMTDINDRSATGFRLTLVAPSVVHLNRLTDSEEVLDGSFLACAYAGKLCSIEPQVSGTNEVINVNDIRINTITGKDTYTKDEQEQLLRSSVAVVSKINNQVRMVRAVTAIGNSTDARFEEIIVDIVDEINNRIEDFLQTVIGQPNTEARRQIYTEKINSILEDAVEQELLNAFENTIVEVAQSPDTINVEVDIQPVFSTNFVRLNITSR